MSALDELIEESGNFNKEMASLAYLAREELHELRASHGMLERDLAYQEETVLPKLRGNLHVLHIRLATALPRIHQSKANDEFCRECRTILEIIHDPEPVTAIHQSVTG